MNASEFINKWRDLDDTDKTPLVGIEKNWDKINELSQVKQYSGLDAWQKIYEFTPPWNDPGNRITFRDLIFQKKPFYIAEIEREKSKLNDNKFNFIITQGLVYPLDPKFIAFADMTGKRGVLGDGCHRFLVGDYIHRSGIRDLSEFINQAELDVIILENFHDVIPFDPFDA